MSPSPIFRTARCVTALALLSFVAVAVAAAQPAAVPGSQQVTLSLDRDLITFAKWAVSLGGVFLVVFAGIGVLFFGWDVSQTRKAMLEAREDIAKRLELIRADHAALKELKERLEQLGAQLDEQLITDAAPQAPPPKTPDRPSPETPPPVTPDQPVAQAPSSRIDEIADATAEVMARRAMNNAALVEAAIVAAPFEWITIGALEKQTGLSEDEIYDALRFTSGVEAKHLQSGARMLRLSKKRLRTSPSDSTDAQIAALRSKVQARSHLSSVDLDALLSPKGKAKPQTYF